MSAPFSTEPPVAARDTSTTIRSGYAPGASTDRQCTHSPAGTEPNGSLRVIQGRVHAESSLRAVDDSVSTVQRRLRSLQNLGNSYTKEVQLQVGPNINYITINKLLSIRFLY